MNPYLCESSRPLPLSRCELIDECRFDEADGESAAAGASAVSAQGGGESAATGAGGPDQAQAERRALAAPQDEPPDWRALFAREGGTLRLTLTFGCMEIAYNMAFYVIVFSAGRCLFILHPVLLLTHSLTYLRAGAS